MDKEKISLHEFVFAALMQNIGKVLKRAELPHESTAVSHEDYPHAPWTNEFLAKNKNSVVSEGIWQRITNLASLHYSDSEVNPEDKKFLMMLKAADQIAADKDEKSKQGNKNLSMYSVFQEISLKSDKKINHSYVLPIKPLSPENIKPEKITPNSKVKDYQTLYTGFITEYELLSEEWSDLTDFPRFLSSVDHLLKKHFYCVPSNVQEQYPTGSLYHHSKTTALIAATLYEKYHEHEGELSLEDIKKSTGYLLIGGDLSGIQNYLYDLNPENSKYSAKLLRARSFKIKALSDMLIFKIINECGLCQQNILINAGGKFILLAPYSDDINEKLKKIQQEVDEAFYHEFLGAVSLNMDWSVNAKFMDLNQENFKTTLSEFFDQLEKRKYTRFKSRLTNSETGKWNTTSFIVNNEKIVNDSMCKICNRRLKSHNKEACHICNKEINLGENLPKKQYITIAMNAEEQGNVQLSDISLYLDSEEGLTPRKNKFIKEGINFEVYAYKKGEGKRYLAYPLKATAAYTHTDKDGRITDFEVLSKKASVNWGDKGITGLQANAIIKGDVDDLGAIFQKGLAKDDKLSLARYVATSSMMDFFFSEYIPWLLENESAHFNNVSIPFDPIYTVYTGGDDFCLVGPWLNVLLFAKRLRDDFASFTCNNPEIHFSCGIELLHGKSPVKYSIEQTEKALGLAKKTHDLKYKETYKNSVYVFETLIPWDEYNDFIKEAETYLSWLQENNKEGFTTQL
ncbi:MAG TPA: type III-A CRISPR-associated protein Cas10/Csm1, partial [Candidatus Cloacimonadota bacterium]|nr:type III-A CRISPR-associated protein Cas10/Csm1 [Candidatus Cloacimonadota bacterium]